MILIKIINKMKIFMVIKVTVHMKKIKVIIIMINLIIQSKVKDSYKLIMILIISYIQEILMRINKKVLVIKEVLLVEI